MTCAMDGVVNRDSKIDIIEDVMYYISTIFLWDNLRLKKLWNFYSLIYIFECSQFLKSTTCLTFNHLKHKDLYCT